MKSVTETLKKIINEHGIEILSEDRRVNAILADLHPKERSIRNLIELSLRKEIPTKIYHIQKGSENSHDTHIAKLKHYFKEEYPLENEAVNSVFDCWIDVMNKFIEKTKTSAENNKITSINRDIVKTNNQGWLNENAVTTSAGKRIKRPPNYIILKQALRYLYETDKIDLKNKLSNFNILHKRFLTCLQKNFDIEIFKTNPLIWQDIWLYNFIKYDVATKLSRTGLIAKYEREVFIDDDAVFFASRENINNRKLLITPPPKHRQK